VIISAGVVEDSFQTALNNISGLCTQLLLRRGVPITRRFSPVELVCKTHVALRTSKSKQRKDNKKEKEVKIQEASTERKLGSNTRKTRIPFSVTSTFSTLTPISQTFTYKPKEPRKTFYSERPNAATNLFQQKKESSLAARVEEKQRIHAEKMLKLQEEKEKREEERKKKEEERKQREEEFKRRSEQITKEIEERRQKLEREREKAMKKLQDRLAEFKTKTVFSFDAITQPQDEEEDEEEKAKLEEERIKAEKEKKKKEIKAEKRSKKRAQNKQQQEEYELQKQQKLQDRRRKREEEAIKKQEEEESIKKQKEIARLEYAARKEKKRLKVEKEQELENSPAPTDDARKLFVGGLNLDDLKKLNITLDPESEKALKLTRAKHLFKLFALFGDIEKIRDYTLSKNHFFVSYTNEMSCKDALKLLTNYDERRKFVKHIRETLTTKEAINAPNAHFYVRSVNSLQNGRKKREFKPSKNKPQVSNDTSLPKSDL